MLQTTCMNCVVYQHIVFIDVCNLCCVLKMVQVVGTKAH